MTVDASTRHDGRLSDQTRPITFERGVMEYAEGSCLSSFGKTRVLCTVSIEDRVPPFLMGSGQGWLTAEYAMLPKSTRERISRDRNRGGRAQEIQRLIGRSLRSVMKLDALGERTLYVDCDVIQADGGTRTAAISGAAVALCDALTFLKSNKLITEWPLAERVAAVSVGVVEGEFCLDLDYKEDSNAEVDFNVVKTESGDYVEVQGAAEQKPFSQDSLKILLELADKGISHILDLQAAAMDAAL